MAVGFEPSNRNAETRCQLPKKNGAGSIVLEKSGQVSGGIFLRISSEHAGSLTTREALDQGIEFFEGSLERLGFDVDWGQ